MTNEEAIRILKTASWLIWGQATVMSKEVERAREAAQMAIDALKCNDIIACGDCKHYIPHDKRCGYWNHGVQPLMWCSQAERRWSMSVLIKGMEMPDKCGQCPCFHYEYPMYCQAVCRSSNKYMTVGAPYGMPRPDWCPLVEVPTPHGRLIDADATVKVWSGCTFRGNLNPLIEVRPTVIEAEGGEHE